jgi:uncharacterized protein YfdQ (DUF2303 family)
MDSDTVITLSRLALQPQIHKLDEEHQFMSVPESMSVRSIKEFLPPPDRIKQRVELLSVDSFCAYLERYATGDSLIFADEPNAKYDCVLDYHPGKLSVDAPSSRGHADHVVAYTCPQSDPWKLWNQVNGVYFGQVEFAEFVEQNLKDILRPSSAELMQVALELRVHKTAHFQSDIRLDNGQVQLRYEEEIRSETKQKDLVIPTELELALPVFVDGPRYGISARFRYTMTEGKLKMGIQLIRPKDVYNAAVKEVTKAIVDGAEGVKLIHGVRR